MAAVHGAAVPGVVVFRRPGGWASTRLSARRPGSRRPPSRCRSPRFRRCSWQLRLRRVLRLRAGLACPCSCSASLSAPFEQVPAPVQLLWLVLFEIEQLPAPVQLLWLVVARQRAGARARATALAVVAPKRARRLGEARAARRITARRCKCRCWRPRNCCRIATDPAPLCPSRYSPNSSCAAPRLTSFTNGMIDT